MEPRSERRHSRKREYIARARRQAMFKGSKEARVAKQEGEEPEPLSGTGWPQGVVRGWVVSRTTT